MRRTRIVAFSINGWDSHNNQARSLKAPLNRLAETILTLQAGLGADWKKTAILAMTEFGRTAPENGTGGTMLMAGGAIRGLFGLDRSILEGAVFPGLDMANVA